MIRALMTSLIAVLALIISVSGVFAQNRLVADLDEKEVRITTGFTGTELLLFGALDRAGVDDIAIIVTGPSKTIAVRRKSNVAGVWLNTDNANVIGLPSFYHILSTRPLEEIASENTMRINQLGFDHIPFRLDSESEIDEAPIETWKAAMVRNLEKTGLWSNQPGKIKVISNVLFRTDISIPANIIPGDYEVRTLHFRDGAVVEENVSTINVVKRGLSAEIYRIAHEYAPFYGIFAIIFAVAAGWLAAVAFRR